MSFVITEHLDELTDFKQSSTWAEARCPVCGGKLKINLSSKSGAYACYTDGCHDVYGKNKIREKLFRPTLFRKNSVFKNPAYKTQKLPNWTTSKTDINLNIRDYYSQVLYVKPDVVGNSTESKITYDYGEFRVCRVDRKNSGKFIYTEFLDAGIYVKGVPSSFSQLPFYKQSYIQPSLFMVEGEKCADALQAKGFAALTPHVSVFNESKLPKLFVYLQREGVTSVIYLEDNDIVGKKKGQQIQTAAWSAGINCISINPAELLGVDIMEYDVADAFADGYSIKDILKGLTIK